MTDQISTAEQPTATSAEQLPQPQPQPHQPPDSRSSKQPQQPQQSCSRDADRLANWLLGVEPQDVRFPLNIGQLAFTASYFAALTSDRRKVYVNRRAPGWCGNCKRRSIDFPTGQRPSSIVSFDHRDTLCVVFRCRIEFFSLETIARVGAYETATAEVAAAGARGGRSPLGALWCSPLSSWPASAASAAAAPPEAAFTVWTDRTEAPQRALLLGPSVIGRPERFLCFYWTSADTVLLVSRQDTASSAAQHPQQAKQQQPLVFCAYDTTGRRPMQRLCRRSVHSARQFCLSPDGRLLLLSGGSRHQLLEAATLRQLLALPRRPATPLPMAVTNCGDIMLLQLPPSVDAVAATAAVAAPALEVHRRGGLDPPARFELAGLLQGGGGGSGDCRVYAVGEFGALLVFEQDAASVATSVAPTAATVSVANRGRAV